MHREWLVGGTQFLLDIIEQGGRLSKRQARRVVRTYAKRSRWYPIAMRKLATKPRPTRQR